MIINAVRLLLVTLSLGLLLACSQNSTPAPVATSTATSKPTVAATSTPSVELVKVSKDGTKFEPPVAKEKVPHEAWACVMNGTVHYASLEKGEGKCPTCKMKLLQHAAHQDQ